MKLKEIIPEWRYYRDNHGYGEAELRALAAQRIKNGPVALKNNEDNVKSETEQSFKDWVLNSNDKTAGAIRGYTEAWGTRPLLALKGISDTIGITEPDANNRFAKLQLQLDKKRKEVSELGITPERKKEIESLELDMQNAKGVWDNIKSGGKYLLDMATHPSEWSTQGIVSQAAPENVISFGAGGIAAKAASTLGKRLAVGAAAGAAENVALGSGYNYLADRGSGKTHDEAKKKFQQSIALDAAVGSIFGLSGAGAMHRSLKKALDNDTALKSVRSIEDVKKVQEKVDYDDMQISMMLNQGKEVSPEVSGANILIKLKNTIEDGTLSQKEVYDKLGEYGLSGKFRMKAYEAYEKGDEKILGQWMDEQMGRFQKLETPQTKQTSKPSSEFDKALGGLGENDLPTLRSSVDNVKQNNINANEKALNEQQSVGRQNNISSSELPNNYIDKTVEPSQIKGDNFVMNESSRQNYPDRIKFELSEYLKSNTDINENPITASLNYLYNHHKDDGMFKSRKEVYELIKNVLDDVPDIVRKQDDGTYYFAKSLLQEPSNRQSIMQDIVLEPQVAENYIKHANTKHYSKEMSDKIRADGGSIQSPQLPQGAKTLENPELKNFSSTDDIIPQNQIKGKNFVASETSKPYYPENATIDIDEALRNEYLNNDNPVVASIAWLYERHPEMFKSKADVYRTIQAVKENPDLITSGKSADSVMLAKKLNDEKMGDMVISKGDENKIIHANKRRLKQNETLGRDPHTLYTPVKQAGELSDLRSGANAHSSILEASNEIIPQQGITNQATKEQQRLAKLQGRNAELLGGNELVESSRSARLDRHSDTSQTMATANAGSATDEIIPQQGIKSPTDNPIPQPEMSDFAKAELEKMAILQKNAQPVVEEAPKLITNEKELLEYADKYFAYNGIDVKLGDFKSKSTKPRTYFSFEKPNLNDMELRRFQHDLEQKGLRLEPNGARRYSITYAKKPKATKTNTQIYAKGGDNLMAGLVSGVEEDEDGNLSINPAKFIAGLGGYTVAKKLLQNPKVQKELKNVIGEQLAKLESRAERGDTLAQTIIGKNFLFTDPHLPNGKYMKGAFSDTATKQVMGEIDDSSVKTISKGELETLAKSDPYNMTELPLDRVLKHDELFAKYPELKNTKVVYESAKGEDELYYGANFDPKDNVIYLGNGVKSNEIKSALLHEIQHVIQTKNKWAEGGNPSEFTQNAFQRYKNLHGEQMARATEYRQNMSPDERIRESYTDTLKRVEGEAPEPIVKHGYGKALSYETKRKYTNLRTGKLLENELRKDAELLPKPLNKKEFIAQFGTTGWAKVKTPLGDVQLEVFKTWKHITDNTYHENRTNISGAFVKTLQDPLIIVHNPQKKQFEYYAPFKDGENTLHLMSINKKADGKIKNVTYFNAQNSMEKIKNIINSTDENTKYFKYAKNKMMSVGEPADIRLTQVNANKQTSNSSLLNEILPNHPQKVKPADLTGNKLKGEYIKQKLESDTPHTMLYEADDIFTKDGKINLGLDIKDKRILKYLKDNGFKNENGKFLAANSNKNIKIAQDAQKMIYKKQVDVITRKMLEC